LAGTSAVCGYQDLIERIFLTPKMQKNEIYCLCLFLNGVWEPVILDGMFPVIPGNIEEEEGDSLD